MPTTYTPILQLALPATGELNGTWGTTVNDNITSMVEQAIAGLATVNTWTAASHTLTTANGTTSEARCAILQCSGAPGAAATVICPTASKVYIIKNSVTGGYAVTLKTSAGTGVSVANGSTALLYCDGTNVVSGGGLSGDVVGPASATDTAIATFDGVTGKLIKNNASVTIAANIITALGFTGPHNGTVGATTPAAGAFTTLSATGITTVAAGSAANPAIVSTTGTADTGIFFPAADTIAFAEGGVEAMRLDSNGNVGIGTTTSASATALTVQIESPKNTVFQGTGYGVAPSINLRAAGGTASSPSATASTPLNIVGATTDDGTTFRNTVSIVGTIESTPTLTSHPTAILFNTTSVNSISRVERMRIDSAGNVGIGTSSPGAKLAVVGTGYSPTITITDGATLNWDTSLGQVAQVTLGGNRTFAAPTNLVNGGFYSLLIIQDGTGSRTISWNAVFDFAGGTAPTLSTAAGSKDLITWRSDGTNMLEVGRSLGVA